MIVSLQLRLRARSSFAKRGALRTCATTASLRTSPPSLTTSIGWPWGAAASPSPSAATLTQPSTTSSTRSTGPSKATSAPTLSQVWPSQETEPSYSDTPTEASSLATQLGPGQRSLNLIVLRVVVVIGGRVRTSLPIVILKPNLSCFAFGGPARYFCLLSHHFIEMHLVEGPDLGHSMTFIMTEN